MSMDDRQQHVQVGAGLQESRLNTEFIDFLKKWGTTVLYVVAALVLVFFAYEKWQGWQRGKLDQAFTEYNAASAAGNPENLLALAEQHKGQGGIWELATLSAVDHYLVAVRRGYKPGADMTNPAESDALTEAQSTEMLNKAESLLKQVLDSTRKHPAKLMFTQQARWNLATVAINKGDTAAAKSFLQEYIDAATKADIKTQAALAQKRLDSLSALASLQPVYTESQLPESARPPAPAPSVQLPPGVTVSPGTEVAPINLTPADPTVPTPAPEQPQEAPAAPEQPTPAPGN